MTDLHKIWMDSASNSVDGDADLKGTKNMRNAFRMMMKLIKSAIKWWHRFNEKWHNLNEKWHKLNYIWQTQYFQPKSMKNGTI